MFAELLAALLALLVLFQWARLQRTRRALVQAEAEGGAMRLRLATAGAKARASRVNGTVLVSAPSSGRLALQTVGQDTPGGASTSDPGECALGRHVWRRWMCLCESRPSSGGEPSREQLWDGCGLNPSTLSGRTIAVEGGVKGHITGASKSRWGSHSIFVVTDSEGAKSEHRLLLDGSGTPFQVEDTSTIECPWRWSFDNEFRPFPPSPGWGFCGNLEPAQEAAAQDVVSATTRNGVAQLDMDGALQFLRATSFNAQAALDMFELGKRWRSEIGMEKLMSETRCTPPRVISSTAIGKPLDPVDAQRHLQAMYPHLMCGYDRDGRPVRIDCMGRIRTKLLFDVTTDHELMRYHIYQNEEIVRRFLPAANIRGPNGSNHREITVILDMNHAKLTEMMSSQSRGHIQNFLSLQNYYPEMLGLMLIVNAPKILSLVWDSISPMLDERTKSKIVICPPGPRSICAMQRQIHPSQLPRFLGGQLDTPLDPLINMPRAENHDMILAATAALGDWDGYWGLPTVELSPKDYQRSMSISHASQHVVPVPAASQPQAGSLPAANSAQVPDKVMSAGISKMDSSRSSSEKPGAKRRIRSSLSREKASMEAKIAEELRALNDEELLEQYLGGKLSPQRIEEGEPPTK